jgi:type VI secretion system protein VasG
MSLNLRTLVNKLDSDARQSLESASAHCLSRNQQEVELEHWLFALLLEPDAGFALFCQSFGLDTAAWRQNLEDFINQLPGDCRRQPVLSQTLVLALEKAWLFASLECQQSRLQSPHLIGALLRDRKMAHMLATSCEALYGRVTAGQADAWIPQALWENDRKAPDSLATRAPGPDTTDASAASETPNLDRFTEDLTARALAGGMDPIVGRDEEVRNMIDILIRRRQNNPILTGEAGVGKTAVVESLAQKVAAGDVPAPLQGAQVRALDLGLLQAGAGVRGEFEKRLKGVISEIAGMSRPVILFIDEAHTLIGAGAGEGQNDASNLLKPALARGELRTVAATTWREYKKYVETDPALTRRFQVVHIHEPNEENAVNMMRALGKTLRDHHRVTILDEAIVAAVQLSARYIPGRQLPDKAVSLLDTACARVSLSQSVTPGELTDQKRHLQKIAHKREWLLRENLSSGELTDTIARLDQDYKEAQLAHDELAARWQTERELVAEITGLRRQLEEPEPSESKDAHPEHLRGRLGVAAENLRQLQAGQPLVNPVVDRQAIAGIVAQWTGIPVGQMFRDEIRSLLDLQGQLERRVIGQSQAMAPLARRIQSARADLTEPDKPVGVFLMIGPSGTGKTETALTLARELFGGEGNLTVINMSEFKEQHKVSMLLGSPPGYVGYGEGGVLTEAVRRKPYSVVLLDEMEKAHPGLQDVFYSIFDKGTARDGEGRDIDFRNTVIIMTSNACEETIRQRVRETPDITVESLLQACQPGLAEHFKPAFLGRTTIVPYYPLGNDTLAAICASRLDGVVERVRRRFGARLTYDEGLLTAMANRSQNHDTGARFIENMVTNEILPDLARECLSAQADQRPLTAVHISLGEGGQAVFKVDCQEPTAAAIKHIQ